MFERLRNIRSRDGVEEPARPQQAAQDGQNERVDPVYTDDIKLRLTWSLNKIQGFNRSLNPAHLAALKEAIKTEARREANTTDYFKWIVMLAIIMMVGALAYYIVSSGSAGSAVGGLSGAAGGLSGGTSVSLLAGRMKPRTRRGEK